jgi:hypothetical protein
VSDRHLNTGRPAALRVQRQRPVEVFQRGCVIKARFGRLAKIGEERRQRSPAIKPTSRTDRDQQDRRKGKRAVFAAERDRSVRCAPEWRP